MKNFNLKSKKVSKRLSVTVIFLSLSISLAFFLPVNAANQFKHGVSLPLVPLQKASFFALGNFNSFWSRLFSFWTQGEERDELNGEIENLKNVVIKQADIIFKLKNEIRGLSVYHDRNFTTKPVIADIIGYDSIEFKKSILIDVGSKHGINVDDTVISSDALIGRVSSVSKFTSRVQLITDPDIRVPARVLETRDQGIIKGTSGSGCNMIYVPDTSIAKEGNRVVTSGVGGIYPASVYIGSISKSIKKEGELFLHISVKPIVNISKIESVLVIKQENRELPSK